MISALQRIALRFFQKFLGTTKHQSRSTCLLIGQGIATVGIEDRELVELDTASSDSAFGELTDSEPEDGEEPETLADGGDLAGNGDTNSADVGDELKLDAALTDVLAGWH